MYVDLKEKGITCSENRVARLMKSHQIAANRKRKFVVTTDSNHDLPVAENKLSQDFTASNPNQNGSRISPISGPQKGGYTWQWY